MCRAGFAVLPANGKKPLKAGFPKWKSAPGLAVIEKWAAQDPAADIVYVAGLSCVVVVDGDDADACGRIVETWGDTPGKTRTRRGRHHLYRDTGQLAPMLKAAGLEKLSSLKSYGINADLKHGQAHGKSIVVAPPSRHEKDRAFTYAWDGCDETVIRDLPPFNVRALQALIDRTKPNPEPRKKPNPRNSEQCN
jgi:hypothetical protein